MSYEQVYQELIARDKSDMERAVDPLQIVDDALVIDTSELTIDQAVELIINKAEELKEKQS